MNKFFQTLFSILLASSAASACAETVKLGIVAPLSGSAGLMGDSLRGVAQIADLKNLELIFEDDRCDGKTALSAYLKLHNEGVRLFYMACSGSILAVAPHAKRNGDLILTSYAGSSRIRESGDEVIRLNPDAVSVAEGLAKIIPQQQRPAILLYEEQEYASSAAGRLGELLGPGIAEKISYRPDAESFNTEILRIKQKKPKSVIIVPVADAAARILLRQLAQNGVHVPVFGEVNLCDYPFTPAEHNLHGKCVAARFQGAAYEDFLQTYAATLKRAPAYPFYDAMALDLFTFLDTAVLSTRGVPDIKARILQGFDGKFAKYRFSSSGEAEAAGDYLIVKEF